ncbi:hypothetical protein FGD77_15810 [Roseovarius sp. M141]|nr:hypothetical protein [Roseovarius sp. M141]
MRSRIFSLCLVALTAPAPAYAANPGDPTWPCVQRKVETLSPGLMWPHPINEAPLREAIAADAADLAAKLEQRRVDLDEAKTLIAQFVTEHPDVTQAEMGQMFLHIFDRINRDRRALIAGIGKYAQKQIALSDRIDEARISMNDLTAATPPDRDAINSLQQQIAWDERVFQDRSRSLTYVCETPVLLEQRLYAIAQLLLSEVPQ